jgi:hypothetical protein
MALFKQCDYKSTHQIVVVDYKNASHLIT